MREELSGMRSNPTPNGFFFRCFTTPHATLFVITLETREDYFVACRVKRNKIGWLYNLASATTPIRPLISPCQPLMVLIEHTRFQLASPPTSPHHHFPAFRPDDFFLFFFFFYLKKFFLLSFTISSNFDYT